METARKIEFEVVQQMEVLREFAADILADLDRYIEKEMEEGKEEPFVMQIKDTLVDEYDGIYNIRSMKEAMIVRGKLQIINDSLKKVGK